MCSQKPVYVSCACSDDSLPPCRLQYCCSAAIILFCLCEQKLLLRVGVYTTIKACVRKTKKHPARQKTILVSSGLVFLQYLLRFSGSKSTPRKIEPVSELQGAANPNRGHYKILLFTAYPNSTNYTNGRLSMDLFARNIVHKYIARRPTPHLRVLLRAGVHAQQRREPGRVVDFRRPFLHVPEDDLELLGSR